MLSAAFSGIYSLAGCSRRSPKAHERRCGDQALLGEGQCSVERDLERESFSTSQVPSSGKERVGDNRTVLSGAGALASEDSGRS